MKKLSILTMLALTACTKYPPQKTPWPVGKTPIYLNDIKLPLTEPLTIDSVYFDATDIYDGNYHYFYAVHDINGKQFTHIIDYQLKDHK